MKATPTPKAIYKKAIEQYFECKAGDYSIVDTGEETGVTVARGEQRFRVETLSDRTIISAEFIGDMLGARLVIAVMEEDLAEELTEITGDVDERPEFVFEIVRIIEEDFFAHQVMPGKVNLALVLGMCNLSGCNLWEALGSVDNDLAAAAVVAAGRLGDRGALAQKLAQVYFRRGEQYLCQFEGGVFANFTCGQTEVIIYEIENQE